MLEILREEVPGEDGRVPNDEGGSVVVPGDDVVDGLVLDELVGLGEERRRNGSLRLCGGGEVAVVFHRRRRRRRSHEGRGAGVVDRRERVTQREREREREGGGRDWCC